MRHDRTQQNEVCPDLFNRKQEHTVRKGAPSDDSETLTPQT